MRSEGNLMRVRATPAKQGSRSDPHDVADVADQHGDVLSVLRAGQRARSTADVLTSLALPAVFLDRHGRVLHVGPGVATILPTSLELVADHLIGRTDDAKRKLQSLLSAALDDGETTAAAAVVIGASEAEPALTITALRCGDRSPYQLLRAILIFEPATREGRGMSDARQPPSNEFPGQLDRSVSAGA